MTEKKIYTYLNASKTKYIGSFFCNDIPLTNQEVVELLRENEELKQQINELQYNKAIGQQEYQKRLFE